MDIKKHKEEFDKIIRKYNLSAPDKAEEISQFLTSKDRDKVSYHEFSKFFNMTEDEAKIFLSFIEIGLEFKKKHIDKE